jgi:hypothetical protein
LTNKMWVVLTQLHHWPLPHFGLPLRLNQIDYAVRRGISVTSGKIKKSES